MSEHSRTTDDELTRRIARALRSRENTQPDADAVAALIEARLAAQPSSVTELTRRGGKVVVAGVVISALAVAGAGAAAAANPYSGVARAVENVVQAVGIDWSAMPDGYTREQYEAFWGAGFSADDVQELGGLWNSEATETKARAGQMILDGLTLPVAPDGTDDSSPEVVETGSRSGEYTQAQYEAFWGAGYSPDDVADLGALWNSDATETKARAGQMILDGLTLPFAPGQSDDATHG